MPTKLCRCGHERSAAIKGKSLRENIPEEAVIGTVAGIYPVIWKNWNFNQIILLNKVKTGSCF